MKRSRRSNSPLPPRPLRLVGGVGVAAAIAGLVALVLWSIAAAASAEPAAARAPIDVRHLLAMTSIQAGLTTVLSLLVGTALAWALNRLRFPGRELAVGLFASAIGTPGLVVAFGRREASLSERLGEIPGEPLERGRGRPSPQRVVHASLSLRTGGRWPPAGAKCKPTGPRRDACGHPRAALLRGRYRGTSRRPERAQPAGGDERCTDDVALRCAAAGCSRAPDRYPG